VITISPSLGEVIMDGGAWFAMGSEFSLPIPAANSPAPMLTDKRIAESAIFRIGPENSDLRHRVTTERALKGFAGLVASAVLDSARYITSGERDARGRNETTAPDRTPTRPTALHPHQSATSAASDKDCPRGSAPRAPGVPQYSRFPCQAAPPPGLTTVM
jgi:hypothetical protein